MYERLKDYRKLEEQIAYLEHNLNKTKRDLRRWGNIRVYIWCFYNSCIARRMLKYDWLIGKPFTTLLVIRDNTVSLSLIVKKVDGEKYICIDPVSRGFRSTSAYKTK